MPLSVALDVDPGIDDALAIMLALRSPELRVELITTVAGNGPLQMTTRNALRVLHYMGVDDIPVHAGAERPLRAPFHGALGYHGQDALGNSSIPDSPRAPCQSPASDALYCFASAAPGERVIIATGPLTNVALAFQSYPDLPIKLKELVIMGGAFRLTPFGTGNETSYAEFNIWQDPEAAESVFQAPVPISVVSLDVSNDPSTGLNRTDVERLRAAESSVAQLAGDLAAYIFARHDVFLLHDPLAVATTLNPALFEFARGQVHIQTGEHAYRGMTEFCENLQEGHVSVARQVNAAAFKQLVMGRLMEGR